MKGKKQEKKNRKKQNERDKEQKKRNKRYSRTENFPVHNDKLANLQIDRKRKEMECS